MTRAGQYLLFTAVLLLMLSAYVHFLSANAADKNWLLIAARMWLSGKKLYVDIFEVNPPLIIWLYSIPVWVSNHLPFLHLQDYNFLALMGFAAITCVIWICDGLIGRHPMFAQKEGLRTAFVLLLAFIFVFFTAPMYFWDREHIMLVMSFPYVLRFAPSFARTTLPLSTRVAIGMLAAVGFCIKPHALLVFGTLQLIYMIRERSVGILFSIENIIIYVLGIAYLAIIVFGMPDYINTVLRMAMETYSAYSRRKVGLLNLTTFIVIMGLTFADFRPRYNSPLRREIYYFLGVCGGYLAYALANNGWAYTYNPLITIARLLAGLVLIEFLWLEQDAKEHGQPTRPFVFGARSCGVNLILSTLFFLITFSSYFYTFDCSSSLDCRSEKIFLREAKKYHVHAFGEMSLEFYKWSELSRETGERWDTRFNQLWMLPKFLLSDSQFTRDHQWIIEYVGKAYAQDLEHWKPEVVFIDSSPEFFANHQFFDLPTYYSVVPEFREAWKKYTRTSVLDSCLPPPPDDPKSKGIRSNCRFDVYSRTLP